MIAKGTDTGRNRFIVSPVLRHGSDHECPHSLSDELAIGLRRVGGKSMPGEGLICRASDIRQGVQQGAVKVEYDSPEGGVTGRFFH
jgi:hypothetical protein